MSLVGLSGPLWLPLIGTSLGTLGDFICGLFSALLGCAIIVFVACKTGRAPRHWSELVMEVRSNV